MLKKSVTFDNLAEEEVTKDFYFHFNKLEIMELELKTGGLENVVKELTETEDAVRAYDLFKMILLSAYGKKAPNGIEFYKKDPIDGHPYSADLEASPALSEIVIEFLQDPKAGAEFIQECLPQKLVQAALEEQKRLDASRNPTSDQVHDMVQEAGALQADPETAVQPSETVQELRTIQEERKFTDYSREELLVLSDEDFSKLVPSKPTDMTRDQLQIAMERKNRA